MDLVNLFSLRDKFVAVKVRRMRTVRLGNDGVCMKDFEKPGRR
jgi:hypothetical protein